MDVSFKGPHGPIPEPIKAHARRRVARLGRYLPGAEVVLELRKEDTRAAEERYIVQATASDSGKILRAEERARDMEHAVDAAVDALGKQAKRHLQRQHHRDRTSLTRSESAAPVLAAAEASDEDGDAGEDEWRAGRVVRVKRFAVKPMSVAEAIDQTDLLGHDFFLFFNAEEHRYTVLYRRKDGGFGLIIPEP